MNWVSSHTKWPPMSYYAWTTDADALSAPQNFRTFYPLQVHAIVTMVISVVVAAKAMRRHTIRVTS